MNLGIPCDCERMNKNFFTFPYQKFLIKRDGYTVGLALPENIKKQESCYRLILENYSDWYFCSCPHYGHYIDYTAITHDTLLLSRIIFLGDRLQLPYLYALFYDHLFNSNLYERIFYIPYSKLSLLEYEIEYCIKKMEELKIPALCKMEPFEIITSYEIDHSKHQRFFMMPDTIYIFFLGEKIMITPKDTILYPEELLLDSINIFAENLPFKYNGEKVFFTDHFYTFIHKKYPQWTRVVDISTGRFIDIPTEDNPLFVPEYTEFKIIPFPFKSKDSFLPIFNKLLRLIAKARKLHKPLIGSDYQCTNSSFEDFIDKDYF
ncbi:MAG: hypothetical protein N2662_07210 [Bacteroidales bacterium]|nr:hypothetical protein [Bacteroidales bacterium]